MEDPAWGPAVEADPSERHPVANAACRGFGHGARVDFAGGAIDALLLCKGEVLRTSQPHATRFGLAQVRRLLTTPRLGVAHVVFAPSAARPLLLSLVRLVNRTDEPLHIEYTETWSVAGGEYRARDQGACERVTEAGVRALADASNGVRARPAEPEPRLGLVLDVRLAVPPGTKRELSFAYVAPAAEEEPSAMVRGWRGEVAHELEASARAWLERIGGAAEPLAAYRARVSAEPAWPR